jgi:hypothetical protein
MSQPSGPVATIAPLTKTQSLADLVSEVRQATPRPINVLQVTALLETAGITDAIAQRRYGYEDVFALAEDVATGVSADLRQPARVKAKAPVSDRRAMVIDYLRGPFSLLPLVLLTVMINMYQMYGDWHTGRVLILSVSTIGSLLVTGGFVQVLARRVSIYLSQGYVRAARRFLSRVLLAAMVVAMIAACLLAAVGLWSGMLSLADLSLLLTAFVILSSFWLLAAVLSVLSYTHWFGIGLGLGALTSYFALIGFRALGMRPNYLVTSAVLIGYGVCVGVIAAVVRMGFRRQAEHAATQHVVFPPRVQTIVALAPYFVYGIAYLLNVLAGHVGGWIGQVPPAITRSEAVATSELGLTLALTGYMLVGGVAEHTMQRFWQRVNGYQAQTRATAPHKFGAKILSFYRAERKRYMSILALCTIGVALVVGIVLQATDFVLLGIDWTPAATLVFATGTIGYALLALGVFDCMFLITLSQPRFALEALSLGLLVTLGVSIASGRMLGYAYGALGTVAGSTVFLILVAERLRRLMQDADYYYYASF